MSEHRVDHSPSGRVVTATVVRPPTAPEHAVVLLLPVAPPGSPHRRGWVLRRLLGDA